MKTFIKNTLYFIIVLAIFSCSKNKIIDIIDDEIPEVTNFYFKATINGVDYIADEDTLSAFAVVTDNDGVLTAAFGEEFNGAQFSGIVGGIKGFNGAGTYNMADYEGSNITYLEEDISTGLIDIWLANSFTGSGVITVSQYGNGTATGTFSFTGINPTYQTEAIITNGEFHLVLVE